MISHRISLKEDQIPAADLWLIDTGRINIFDQSPVNQRGEPTPHGLIEDINLIRVDQPEICSRDLIYSGGVVISTRQRWHEVILRQVVGDAGPPFSTDRD
jgi:hypothetical protein